MAWMMGLINQTIFSISDDFPTTFQQSQSPTDPLEPTHALPAPPHSRRSPCSVLCLSNAYAAYVLFFLNKVFHPGHHGSHEAMFPGNVGNVPDVTIPTCASGGKLFVQLIIDRTLSTSAPMQAQSCVSIRLEVARTSHSRSVPSTRIRGRTHPPRSEFKAFAEPPLVAFYYSTGHLSMDGSDIINRAGQ